MWLRIPNHKPYEEGPTLSQGCSLSRQDFKDITWRLILWGLLQPWPSGLPPPHWLHGLLHIWYIYSWAFHLSSRTSTSFRKTSQIVFKRLLLKSSSHVLHPSLPTSETTLIPFHCFFWYLLPGFSLICAGGHLLVYLCQALSTSFLEFSLLLNPSRSP